MAINLEMWTVEQRSKSFFADKQNHGGNLKLQ